jgi:ppGpp synthetase/RelA/SpoT-type nucleotidyltranferase
MAKKKSQTEDAQIDEIVRHFVEHRSRLRQFLDQVLVALRTEPMERLAHSVRSRVKDPDHLKDKLLRKRAEAASQGAPFDITTENLFIKVNDLVGVRILHLHTSQIFEIDKELQSAIDEHRFQLLEGPVARTWDDEYRAKFREGGIETTESKNMYTSVHYVISSNSRTTHTCEIQVRTLMEEVWGEVDHTINYPHKTESLACREQIMALARSTSSATRLVDAIFASHADFHSSRAAKKR